MILVLDLRANVKKANRKYWVCGVGHRRKAKGLKVLVKEQSHSKRSVGRMIELD